MQRLATFLTISLLFTPALAGGEEIRVMTSGGFTAAYLALVPAFERETGHKVVTTFGGSMGSGPETIPNRLERGERADVVILASSALEELIRQGNVLAGSRVDLARSEIGMAVRVVFEHHADPDGDVWLPLFEPDRSGT